MTSELINRHIILDVRHIAKHLPRTLQMQRLLKKRTSCSCI
ncbi:DUF6972 family protein [Sphaerospermopsis kisseleviana]